MADEVQRFHSWSRKAALIDVFVISGLSEDLSFEQRFTVPRLHQTVDVKQMYSLRCVNYMVTNF
jgi:hypothetical protein